MSRCIVRLGNTENHIPKESYAKLTASRGLREGIQIHAVGQIDQESAGTHCRKCRERRLSPRHSLRPWIPARSTPQATARHLLSRC